MDPQSVTFAALITPPGIIVAAGLVTTFVQVIKSVFTGIDARVSGALLAFSGSSILYVITAIVLSTNGTITNADGFLWTFTAWLSCAVGAIGIKSAFTHARDAGAKSLPLTDPVDESDPTSTSTE
jgi:hypothetical protein